jgi:hypothetical protein
MNRLWDQFSVRDSIASKLVSHDLPGLAAM